ncbi:hypothetical protein [Secundilactobacillus similis]|uniref:Extracellular protein n=1 Tax=Secundilactobacillus similis DSM 23365 = JCM 2765 TaxID=1423804 RepID=A0A0R2F866_9LACO|nr:hypothetical protein [Secundilactobacillus similis]KRN23814.1 hypothetical protein FD14_GL000565 [Secundilactobacillus similis DSM 23365 = JCM 2765]
MMKTVRFGLMITALLGAGMMAPTVGHAATWHSGTPKVLQGKWKTKSFRRSPNTVKLSVHIGKSQIFGYEVETYHGRTTLDNALPVINKGHYRYLGHHTYYITDLKSNGMSSGHVKVKWYNHHTIKIAGTPHYYYRY